MNKCASCKYWKPINPANLDFNHKDFGTCNSPKLAYTLNEKEAKSDFLCYDADYSGPYVLLFVGKDFGCVHWE